MCLWTWMFLCGDRLYRPAELKSLYGRLRIKQSLCFSLQHSLTSVAFRVKPQWQRRPTQQSDATSRHQDSNMYEGSARMGDGTISQSSQSSQCPPQALVKLGMTRTAMAATATAATARFQPSVSV